MVRQSAWQLLGWDMLCAVVCDQVRLSLASCRLPWSLRWGRVFLRGRRWVVGGVLLGCLLEECGAAESVLVGVEQAEHHAEKPPNLALLVFLPLGLTGLAVPTMP